MSGKDIVNLLSMIGFFWLWKLSSSGTKKGQTFTWSIIIVAILLWLDSRLA